jgi:hypothetical protein
MSALDLEHEQEDVAELETHVFTSVDGARSVVSGSYADATAFHPSTKAMSRQLSGVMNNIQCPVNIGLNNNNT